MPDRQYKPVHGVFLVMQGRLDEAVAEFEKLSKADPEDRPARDLLVATYLKANRIATAQKILDAVLAKNSKDTDALLQRSRVYITTGKYTEAMNDLTKLLSYEPNSSAAHYFIARVYELRGSRQQQQHLTETVRLAPQWLTARIELATAFIGSNQGKAALETLSAASAEQKRSPEFLVAWNWALIRTGDRAGARKGVDQALTMAQTPELYLQDGVLKLDAAQYEAARVALHQSLQGNPNDLRTLDALVETYAGQNRIGYGIQKVRQFIAQRPVSAANQIFLAKWLLKADQTGEARRTLETALKTYAENPAMHLTLAQIDMRDGNVGEAQRRIAGVLSSNPSDGTAHLLMANLEVASGNYAKAIEHYRVPADLGDVTAMNNLAYNLSRDAGQLDDALKYAEMAKQLAPEDSHIQDTLGWIYYLKGMYPRATKELDAALSKEARPGIKLHLGLAYLKSGNGEQGRKLVREAVAAEPGLLTEAARFAR